MEKGTNSETTWTHTAMRLRFYTRRLSVLTRGLAYLNNEAVAIHNAA